MWFSISLPVPGSLKAFPPHPCIQYTISVYVCVDQSRTDLLIFRYFVICSYVLILQIRLVGRLCRSWTELYWTLLLSLILCPLPCAGPDVEKLFWKASFATWQVVFKFSVCLWYIIRRKKININPETLLWYDLIIIIIIIIIIMIIIILNNLIDFKKNND